MVPNRIIAHSVIVGTATGTTAAEVTTVEVEEKAPLRFAEPASAMHVAGPLPAVPATVPRFAQRMFAATWVRFGSRTMALTYELGSAGALTM
jgi:hypothetical protein